MEEANELEKIIHAYGKVLEELSEHKDARILAPESKLPYPREVIRAALQAAIEVTDDKRMKEQLRIGLEFLNDFASDKEVSHNFVENLKMWAIKNSKQL